MWGSEAPTSETDGRAPKRSGGVGAVEPIGASERRRCDLAGLRNQNRRRHGIHFAEDRVYRGAIRRQGADWIGSCGVTGNHQRLAAAAAEVLRAAITGLAGI